MTSLLSALVVSVVASSNVVVTLPNKPVTVTCAVRLKNGSEVKADVLASNGAVLEACAAWAKKVVAR